MHTTCKLFITMKLRVNLILEADSYRWR